MTKWVVEKMSNNAIEKYVYYIVTENICSACNPMQVIVFLQTCINFVEKRLTFSHFEGNIIP